MMDVSVSKKIYTADEYFAETPETNERAELFDGEIVFQAAPGRIHQRLVMRISSKIDSHISSNNGKCQVFPSPFDVKLDDKNVVQPDVLVVCNPNKVDDKRCSGAPDLVIEIVSGTGKNDYGRKYILYRDSGVREYWIIDPRYEKTLVYFWDETEFPEIYTFDKPIPVRIFNSELTIKISEIIS